MTAGSPQICVVVSMELPQICFLLVRNSLRGKDTVV